MERRPPQRGQVWTSTRKVRRRRRAHWGREEGAKSWPCRMRAQWSAERMLGARGWASRRGWSAGLLTSAAEGVSEWEEGRKAERPSPEEASVGESGAP